MSIKNKLKIMALTFGAVPIAVVGSFAAINQNTNIVETVKDNHITSISTGSTGLSTLSTFTEESKIYDIEKLTQIKATTKLESSQMYFIITVSVLGGAFLAIGILIITIILRFKKIKKNLKRKQEEDAF
jgi:general stress protein CsbA